MSLFAGIGGFDLAAHWMGWATAVMVEWEEFPRQVLIKNFNCVPAEELSAAKLSAIIDAWKVWRPGQPQPTTVLYGDIRHFDARQWLGAIDLVCGGFPCQPYSDAGLKLGNDDPRALFPHMLRVICECAARLVLGENVRGLLTQAKGLAFESVCAGLEAEGYEVQPLLLPACGVGAPHKRDRFWFVAHSGRESGHWRQDSESGCEHNGPYAGWQETAGEHQRLGQTGITTHTASCRCDPRQSGVLCQRAGGCAASQRDSQRQALCPAANGCGTLPTYANSERQPQCEGDEPQFGGRSEHGSEETHANANSQRRPECQCVPLADGAQEPAGSRLYGAGNWTDFRLTEPPLCGPDDGLPAGLVRVSTRAKQLKAYGNAIVPQVAYQLFQAIEAVEALEP